MHLELEDKKRIVRDLFEKGWNQVQFDDFSGFFADPVVFNYRGASFQTNLAGLKELIAVWRAAFPDLYFRVIDIIAEGDLVAINLVFTGTHKGPWQDLPPTGNRISVEEMMFFRFDQGKVVELWEVQDEFEMLKRLSANS